MSLITVPGIFLPRVEASLGYTSHLIDAAGEKVAVVGRVTKAGSITHVGFRTGAVTTAQTLRVGLYTVDLTTGNPTTTAYGGMTVGTQTSPAANTWYWVALGTAATAVVGDHFAVTIEFDSTVGALNIVSIGSGTYPSVQHFTTSWAKQTTRACCAVKYDDGTVPYWGTVPLSDSTSLSFSSASSPDEYGMRFKFGFECECTGIEVLLNPNGADCDFVLYSGTTELRSVSVDKDIIIGGARRLVALSWATPVALAAGNEYIVSARPSTTSSPSISQLVVPDSATWEALEFGGGSECYQASRTDLGAWSYTTTSRPVFGLRLSKIDDGIYAPRTRPMRSALI